VGDYVDRGFSAASTVRSGPAAEHTPDSPSMGSTGGQRAGEVPPA